VSARVAGDNRRFANARVGVTPHTGSHQPGTPSLSSAQPISRRRTRAFRRPCHSRRETTPALEGELTPRRFARRSGARRPIAACRERRRTSVIAFRRFGALDPPSGRSSRMGMGRHTVRWCARSSRARPPPGKARTARASACSGLARGIRGRGAPPQCSLGVGALTRERGVASRSGAGSRVALEARWRRRPPRR
jgi:hypothetical protein